MFAFQGISIAQYLREQLGLKEDKDEGDEDSESEDATSAVPNDPTSKGGKERV